MGYDLPAAIGACLAAGRQRIICLAGDGSIQMNLQELQTIAAHHLPIVIFVLNNQGYHSIRQTQTTYFSDSLMGFDANTGVSFAPFDRLAAAFGIAYNRCDSHAGLTQAIDSALAANGPHLCEIMLDPAQPFSPRVSSKKLPDGRMVSAPLDDMFPFLPRDELVNNTCAT